MTEIGDEQAAVNSVAAVSSAKVDILGQFISTSPQTTQTKKKQKRSPIHPVKQFNIAATDTSAMDVDASADVVSSGDVMELVDENWTKVEKRKAKKIKKVEQRAEVRFLFLNCLVLSHFPTGTTSSTTLRPI